MENWKSKTRILQQKLPLEALDPAKTYVVGSLVDRTPKKSVTATVGRGFKSERCRYYRFSHWRRWTPQNLR